MSGPEREYRNGAAHDAPRDGSVEVDGAWWSSAAARMAQGEGAAARAAAGGRHSRAFAGAMSRRAQAADVRGALGSGGGWSSAPARRRSGVEAADDTGPVCEAAPQDPGASGAMSRPAKAASQPDAARSGNGAEVDGPVHGPVGPDDVDLPVSPDMPLMYKPEGGRVLVLPMWTEAPAAGWQAVEPGAQTWPLYFALYLERTDPGEVRYGELGPVVGEAFGPMLLASLGPLPDKLPWKKPGDMPGRLYVGIGAHEQIGRHYHAHHGQRPDIFLNSRSIQAITGELKKANPLKYGHLRPELGDQTRPDITDATLNHLYEIKPWQSAKTGAIEARRYVNAFTKVGLTIRLGAKGVPGTKGRIAGPAGWFAFDVMEAGVIGYRYKKTEPVPELFPLPHPAPRREPKQDPERRIFEWKYWEEVTGLTGAALLAYLIISEGSRIIPLRNAIPVP